MGQALSSFLPGEGMLTTLSENVTISLKQKPIDAKTVRRR
jgi:hypothetical protein